MTQGRRPLDLLCLSPLCLGWNDVLGESVERQEDVPHNKCDQKGADDDKAGFEGQLGDFVFGEEARLVYARFLGIHGGILRDVTGGVERLPQLEIIVNQRVWNHGEAIQTIPEVTMRSKYRVNS